MEWMYYDPNDRAYLDRLKKHSGFSDLPLLEKLVLDFETHYYLKDKFDMVVKGGMAALLHAGPSLQRISEDIDVMTTAPKKQIISILAGLSTDDEEATLKIEGERTRLPNHLLHCEIRCPSSTFQDYCTAKMDILCSIDPSLLRYAVKMRSPTLETLNFKHNIDILSRGALIADKMCTLTSAETVGLRTLRNFPKQVHDVAMLLRVASVDDLQTLFKAYAHFASFTLYMHRQTHSTQDLIDSAYNRCVCLLDFRDSTALSQEYRRFYSRFQSRYVKNRKVHTEAHHIDEILLVLLCAKHLREYGADGDLEKHPKELYRVIRGYMQAREAGKPPALDPGALARIGKVRPNLTGLRAPLTQAQWILLLEVFAPS